MYPTRILVTLITLVGIGAAFVIAIVLTGKIDATSTPLVITVLGFITLIITSVVNGAKTATKVDDVSDKVDQVLNSTMDDKIRAVVRAELKSTGPEFRKIIHSELVSMLKPRAK